MKPFGQSFVVTFIWILLLGGGAWAVYERLWASLFVILITLALTVLTLQLPKFYHIDVPVVFTAAIAIFTYATLIMGEVADFYERVWWWDIALHGGAAIGFGLIGFILIFIMFGGDKYAAPPAAIAWFAFSFGVSLGVIWEVFEFGMDQIFGMSMQKSGLIDTMYDLIVDMIGAGLGSAGGYFYLKGRKFGGLANLIDQFVKSNDWLFRDKD